MRSARSISTRRAYGVQRICRVWKRARSSVYARRHGRRSARQQFIAEAPPGRPGRSRQSVWRVEKRLGADPLFHAVIPTVQPRVARLAHLTEPAHVAEAVGDSLGHSP